MLVSEINHLTFTIEGSGLRPGTVRLRDLIFFLQELESAIRSTSRHLGNYASDVDISLTQIDEAIASYDLTASGAAMAAAAAIADAISKKSSERLPQPAVHNLVEIQRRATRLGHSVKINNSFFSSTITPTTPLFTDALVAGYTTIHAQLNSVGGKRPKAKLVLSDGKNLTADVPSHDFAKILANSLYKSIALEGEASWYASSMELCRFRIHRIGEYDDAAADPELAFKALRAMSGDLWSQVDPDAYVREHRGDDE